MGKFLTELQVQYYDGNFWILHEDLAYKTGSEEVITVPKGFITDFASVPIVCNWFIPKSGKYDPAAVIHDWLYFKKEKPRNVCDGIFCDAMKDLGVNYAQASVMYYALRSFGWIAWKFGRDKRNKQK